MPPLLTKISYTDYLDQQHIGAVGVRPKVKSVSSSGSSPLYSQTDIAALIPQSYQHQQQISERGEFATVTQELCDVFVTLISTPGLAQIPEALRALFERQVPTIVSLRRPTTEHNGSQTTARWYGEQSHCDFYIKPTPPQHNNKKKKRKRTTDTTPTPAVPEVSINDDDDQSDQKALVVKLTKVELNNAIESARRARQVNDNGEHVCGPDCPLRDSALRERQPISEELRGVA
ncbi:hypothetical protein D6C78_07457 [Aureobasidium pullulans]|uniref:Uncharacterized protein n=1 Tax=Aureobasidium pullulans TaxID=5580 RepID=A0A4T0BGP0_AURPU|nr:hypothetical protein D6C78_07457 [Aureobasidium pullulans]